jgi:ribosome maturation factor RimP
VTVPTDLAAVERAVAPVVAAAGLDLYDLELTGSGRAAVLRVLVSAPGGVDLDRVASVAELVSPVLDRAPVAAALPAHYALEVSSPGLERPLRTPAHFRGAAGETVSLKRRAGAVNERIRGVVRDADDDGVTLEGEGGNVETVAYADVVSARTVFEWGPRRDEHKGARRGGRKQEVVRP